MNEMEDMRNNRDYDNRDYRNYRDDYRNYRGDYRDYRNYRDDYRNYRDYDRRGGRRNYREQDYYEELEMTMEDVREQYRKLEDLSEMAHKPEDREMVMKIAEKEKEIYNYLKQMMEK